MTLNHIERVQPELRSSVSVDDIACPPDEVPTATPNDRLVDVLPAMAHRGGDGRVVVLDGPRIAGILTPTDVTRAIELAELRPRLAGPAPRTRPTH